VVSGKAFTYLKIKNPNENSFVNNSTFNPTYCSRTNGFNITSASNKSVYVLISNGLTKKLFVVSRTLVASALHVVSAPHN
jgi:lipocalin